MVYCGKLHTHLLIEAATSRLSPFLPGAKNRTASTETVTWARRRLYVRNKYISTKKKGEKKKNGSKKSQ